MSLALLAMGLALALYGLSWWLAGAAMLLPVLGFGLGAGVSGHFLLRLWHAPRLGYANALTLGRLALAALMLVDLVVPGYPVILGPWLTALIVLAAAGALPAAWFSHRARTRADGTDRPTYPGSQP